MTSAVQICSNALLTLGAKPINSLAPDPQQATSDREQACANVYPMVRDSVLRSHPWNCATKRVVLSPDEAAPAFDWEYQFRLPGDWLRTLSVGEAGYEIPYRIEGARILADTNVLRLKYIWRNEAPATWDSLLVDAVTAAMAARLAVTITADQGKKQEFERALLAIMRTARAVDGQEEPPKTLGDFPLLQARF